MAKEKSNKMTGAKIALILLTIFILLPLVLMGSCFSIFAVGLGAQTSVSIVVIILTALAIFAFYKAIRYIAEK